MNNFMPKFATAVIIAFLCASAAAAGNKRDCHFAFGNGVTEQIVVPADQPVTSNIGPIRLRIGPVMVDGVVDVLMTEGFRIPSMNMASGETRVTGFGKGTFDFGDLGAFHTWEVDTAVFEGPPPWDSSEIIGDIRTGPARDVVPDLQQPPTPWGSGYFAHADASFKGKGWMRRGVVNSEGVLVNEFTYFVWGWVCDVDVRGIRQARQNN